VTYTGACFCGAITIQASGPPDEMGYCHCNSCRAYSGTLVTSFALWQSDKVRVTAGEQFLGRINRTGMTERQFCTRCGGHLMSGHPSLGLTDIHAGILPGLDFRPSVHLNYAETVLPMKDGLPKLRDFPAEVGGSGETVPE
jgi:hypothetical protein